MPSLTELATKHGVFLGRRSTRIHVAVYRWSGGRIGSRFPGQRDASIVLVDHKGARSGVERTSPLIYVEDGDDLAVAASKAGHANHPAWFHNLKANPETTVQVGPAIRRVRARVASDEERELLWPRFVAIFDGYEMYQRYATDRTGRTIPIVILEPRYG
jgi:deazaflavin-dependent oxidoreductase (nitroreductase family)